MSFHTLKPSGKLLLTSITLACLLTTASTAYALNPPSNELTASQLRAMINYTDKGNALEITVTPEVIAEINNIRNSAQARTYIQDALSNMKHYQPIIEPALKNNDMPLDLMALPIVESGYQPLDASKNPMQAAGIWQMIPSTAQKYGLIIDSQRDDRMDPSLSTKAALNYLNNSHAKFNDWRLAVVAYEIGEQQTAALIEKTGSRDPWVLARSPAAPEELKNYLAMFGAAVIMMHNPSLIAS